MGKSASVLLCLATIIMCSANSLAQEPPPCTDSCYLNPVVGQLGVPIPVPIEFENCVDLYGIDLPLTWEPDFVTLDSLSFAGSRLEHIVIKSSAEEIDNDANTVDIFAIATSEGPVTPGRGLLVTLYFTIDTLVDSAITIDTTSISSLHSFTFEDETGTPVPTAFTAGVVTIFCDCGLAGDVDGDGTSVPLDVITLANFVFKGWDILAKQTDCPYTRGDVNCDGYTTPLDVVVLVNFIFRGWSDQLCTPCTD